jgi:hypothetical protein
MKPTNHGAPLRTRHAAWESFLALAAAADGGTSRGRWAKKATSIIAPVAALATLAVLAAGCGGGSSSPGLRRSSRATPRPIRRRRGRSRTA